MNISWIILICVNAFALVLLQLRPRGGRPWLWMVLLSLVGAVFFQLEQMGFRWQIIPLYVLTAALIAVCGGAGFFEHQRSAPRIAFSAGWAVLAGAMALPLIYPIAEFPSVTGPFAVGTVVRHLVDTNRHETLAEGVTGPRELMIQIWYPADVATHAKNAPYVMSAAEVGSFNDSQLLGLDTHALLDAPLSKAQAHYPVVIYTPSWHGQRNQNTVLIEELASHGFVVVGIDHPYGSTITVFPDGRVARAEPTLFWDVASDEALKRSIQYIELQLAVRVKDVEFVVDELQRLNASGSEDGFTGRLDLQRLGVLGYSFGGAVAVQTCWLDRRFRAAVNLDGALFADSARSGIDQPLMVMTDNDPPPSREELTSPNLPRRRYEILIDQQIQLLRRDMENHGGYLLKIDGVDHDEFYDDLIVPPMRRVEEYRRGNISRPEVMKIVNTYTLAFFENSLNGTPQPLLNGPSPEFPDVKLEISSPRHENQ